MSVRRERLVRLLDRFERGELERGRLLALLDREPTERLPFAELDHHRSLRLGHPEAVFAEGKTEEHLLEICRRLRDRGEGFLVTRMSEAQRRRMEEAFPGLELSLEGRSAHLPAPEESHPPVRGEILVVSAGTADLPAAEEARLSAMAMGNPVGRRYDVGVAALGRILAAQEELRNAAVVIVAAGMDGALPSVVGGLVAVPVIALPTSVGYGASFGGVAALLTMLNSCAPGVTVVNIDNGYGAACAATRINQTVSTRPTEGKGSVSASPHG